MARPVSRRSGASVLICRIETRLMTKKRKTKERAAVKSSEFGTGDYVVYPTHGVGRVVGVENQEIAGHTLDLIVIKFEKDRMTLRVPVA